MVWLCSLSRIEKDSSNYKEKYEYTNHFFPSKLRYLMVTTLEMTTWITTNMKNNVIDYNEDIVRGNLLILIA